MEELSSDRGGIAEDGQSNHDPPATSVSPHNRERPQAFSEDIALKTIEFLRARLLAERATSKAARESAEKNAKMVVELEKKLEIEIEQRMKAVAAMQDVREKLQIMHISSVSEHVDSDMTGNQTHTIIEERQDLDGVSLSNSHVPPKEQGEIIGPDMNTIILQDEAHSSANSVQSEERKKESNDFTNETVKTEDSDYKSGFIQDRMSRERENEDNATSISSPSLHDLGEYNATDNSLSSSKDFQDENHNDIHGPPAPKSLTTRSNTDGDGNHFRSPPPERFLDIKDTMHSRINLEEKLTELFHQVSNEVLPALGDDQMEFLRLKLHEFVDQIVCITEKKSQKCENSILQFDHSPKLSAFGRTCIVESTSNGKSENSDIQREDICKGSNLDDSLEAEKSYKSNCDFRYQNEKASAPAIERIGCKRNETECGNITNCCGLRGSICKCQHLKLCGAFLHCKELCRHKLLQDTFLINSNQSQTLDMQKSLENNKATESNHLQCTCLSNMHCNNESKGFQLTMQCSDRTNGTTRTLYHNQEKQLSSSKGCDCSQASSGMQFSNTLESSRFSASDGYMSRNYGLNDSHNTSYVMKSHSPSPRFHQRDDTLSSMVEFSAQGNCHKHLPPQDAVNFNQMPSVSNNVGNSKLYLEYNSSPSFPMQLSSTGPKLSRGKAEEALTALRQAKEHIQRSIVTKQNSSTYISLSSSTGQLTCM